MSLRLVRKLFPSLWIAPERARRLARQIVARHATRVFASRYDAPLRILILFFRLLYETRRESSRTARSSRVPRFPRHFSSRARSHDAREEVVPSRNFSSFERTFERVDTRASRARREGPSAFVRSFEMASRARDLRARARRAIDEPLDARRRWMRRL